MMTPCLYCETPVMITLICLPCAEARAMMRADWFERMVQLAESHRPDVDFRQRRKSGKRQRTKWGESGDRHAFRQEAIVG